MLASFFPGYRTVGTTCSRPTTKMRWLPGSTPSTSRCNRIQSRRVPNLRPSRPASTRGTSPKSGRFLLWRKSKEIPLKMQHHYHPPLYLSYYIYMQHKAHRPMGGACHTHLSLHTIFYWIKKINIQMSLPPFLESARDCFGGCFLQRIFVCLDDCIVNGMSDCKLSDFYFVLNLLAEKLKKKNVLPI